MNILKFLFVSGFFVILIGCSTQSKLIREYKGKTHEELMRSAMGRPTRVETADGGRKIDIYEKSKFLKAATINTGQFQYDKFESPKVIKIEVYKFFLNPSGVIEDVKYDVRYER